MIAPVPSLPRRLHANCGTEIAYALDGEGPGLVLSNGLTSSTHFWRYLQPHWSESHRVLRWDLPGHGRSGPAASDRSATIAGQPDLIAQLMDEAGMASAVQIGWSTGSQVALEMYRQYPARCRALVLLLGSAGKVLSTARLPLPSSTLDWLSRAAPPTLFGLTSRALALLGNAPGGRRLARRLQLIGPDTRDEDAVAITQHLLRIHSPTLQRMMASAQAHDAWELLARIEVPLLIVAGDRDPFAPSETVGVRMQQRCPDAELVRLPEGAHTALLDHAEEIREAVDDFLRRRVG